LQIAAVNGFFGGHVTYTPKTDTCGLALRLRLLHVSAHLIDGAFDNNTGRWQGDRLPIPYTRDFGELVASYEWTQPFCLYGGFSYATLVRPSDIKRVSFLAGLELHDSNLLGHVAGREATLYFAYHFTLSGASSYAGGNSLEGGVKLGAWKGSGVKLYLSYYAGLDVFSQYYDIRRTLWGVGFAFDFW
jgi:hypothetical protein